MAEVVLFFSEILSLIRTTFFILPWKFNKIETRSDCNLPLFRDSLRSLLGSIFQSSTAIAVSFPRYSRNNSF